MMINLTSWFEISEQEYIWYILQGYEIRVSDDYVSWFFDGKLHRIDGPAYIESDGTQEWWVDDKRHRIDGPAIIWRDGEQQWWVDGKQMTAHEFNEIKRNTVD